MSYDLAASRLGVVDKVGGDELALFLKRFGGEILMAFDEKTIFMGRHFVKNVESGKSTQFPKMGRLVGYYHAGDGSAVDFGNAAHGEVVVPIDKQLIVPALISEFDELVNHYEVRSKYAHEIGQELATSFDEHVCIEGLLGARSANELAELPGGGQYVDDLLKNDGGVSGSADDAGVALALVTGVFAAAEAMDNKNVPESGRYIALRPKEYNILIKEAQTNGMSAINKDIDGNGSISKGTIFELAGITILKYPRLPSTNILQGTSDSKNFYHYGDFSKTVGFVWQEDAIGTAKLQGLKMDVKDLTVTHLAHAMLSRYLMGHKVLRPESCFELTLDTLTVA